MILYNASSYSEKKRGNLNIYKDHGYNYEKADGCGEKKINSVISSIVKKKESSLNYIRNKNESKKTRERMNV